MLADELEVSISRARCCIEMFYRTNTPPLLIFFIQKDILEYLIICPLRPILRVTIFSSRNLKKKGVCYILETKVVVTAIKKEVPKTETKKYF